MKRYIFFAPAAVFTVLYSWVIVFIGFSSLAPYVFIWVLLFFLSGVFLDKGMCWGGLLGLLPSIHMMYMSTIDTGQILHVELPVGIVLAVFYLACCGFVFYKNKKQS